MTEFTGAADRDKTLALLWREQLGEPLGARGPKQRLSVDEIVDAAIALADDDGVEAISMRRIAEKLGIGAMSLYTYVDSKSALIDLMVDRITAQIARPPFGDLPWRARLESIARNALDHYLAHPWVLQIDLSRPPIGPGVSDNYEYQLNAVEGIGLNDLEMDAVITLLGRYVESTARANINADRAAAASGQSETQWWGANLPVLDAVMEGDRFPVSGRVGTAAGMEYQSLASPDHGFEFGLRVVLDGVDGLVRRASRD